MSSGIFRGLVALVVIAGGVFLWWNLRPEQKVNRQVDEVLEEIRFQRLSLKTTEDRKRELAEVLSDSIAVSGDRPIPSTTLNQETFLEKLTELHGYLSILKIEETGERVIEVEGDSATATVPTSITGAAGEKYSRTMPWTLRLTFAKSDRWRLTELHGTTTEEVDL